MVPRPRRPRRPVLPLGALVDQSGNQSAQSQRRDVPGPVVLFDSAWPGDELESENHLRVELGAGRYSVRAAYVEPNPKTSLNLVQLRRLP
ncbi:Imm21 family immunity protein [Streptomyces sp. NPDC055105]|uniref:Imm21 family immunity protein n=1 Tax=Streptomyces sp. NPDC055105 TaxID=3365719 RepID=UPI0037D63722